MLLFGSGVRFGACGTAVNFNYLMVWSLFRFLMVILVCFRIVFLSVFPDALLIGFMH